MDNQGKEQTPITVNEPIGEVILGDVNPRELTNAQFRSSPNLLFHGTGRDFIFFQDFDYKNFDNSSPYTIGEGFYATSKKEDAELYSLERNIDESHDPIVVEIMPYQAKMFDFRSKQDLAINALVPHSLLFEYMCFCEKTFKDKYEGYDPSDDIEFINSTPYCEERGKKALKVMSQQHFSNYIQILDKYIKEEKPIDLRTMLSLTHNASNSQYGAELISDFMQSKGYDGLIYVEGGEHQEHKNPTSYTFFNLKKIGNFGTWNPNAKSTS